MNDNYYCLKNYMETKISKSLSLNDNVNCSVSKMTTNLAPVSLDYSYCKGRFIVSSKDIAKGEIIFWETPVVIAPQCGAGPSCLDCCLLFSDKEWPHCKGCGLPRCFPVCEGKQHSQEECRIFSQLSLKDKEDVGIVKQINLALTPLRSWFQILTNNDIFKSLANNLEERNSCPIGIFVEKFVVKFIVEKFSMLNIPVDFIRQMCGVFDTNAFEISVGSKKARALLPAASLMNHSCNSNTQHWFHNGQCVVRASVNIKTGEPITNNYTQVLWPTITRRRHLSITKYFWCNCLRCEDPSEFDTNLSSLACKTCPRGMLKPNDDETQWQCLDCKAKVSSKQVSSCVSVASSVAAHAGNMDGDSLLRAIAIFEGSLGSHHYITIELKICYVKIIASSQSENMENLLRVIYMCQFLLTVLQKINPGYTKLRGLILLYKSKVFVEILQRLKEKCNVDDFPDLNQLIHNHFENFVEDSAESMTILKFDSEAQSSRSTHEHLTWLRKDFSQGQ